MNVHRPRVPNLVSVVMPAFNASSTIEQQLGALGGQDYDGRWELIVADNGSTDATVGALEGWAREDVPAQVVDASGRRGSAFARNRGVAAARGDFLAFCDADDLADPGWLSALVTVGAEADVVAGRLEVTRLNREDTLGWRQLPVPARLQPDGSQAAAFAPSGNFAIWTEVFRSVHGFDESYPKSHDVELSLRLRAAGFQIRAAPEAVIHYRYRASLPGLMRQAFLSGRAAAQLHRDHGSRGPRRRSTREAIGAWAWLVPRLPYLVSPRRRGMWLRRAAEGVGRLVGSIRYRTYFP